MALAVEAIFQACWGRDVVLSANPGEVPDCRRFHLIPGRDGPRWVVPCDPAYGLSVLARWRPYSWRARVAWEGLVGAYRAGLLDRVPGIRTVGVEAGSRTGYPSLEEVIPVIYVGTPGPSRKLVATLVDRASRSPVSLFKAPLAPGAGTKIVRELGVLERLSRTHPGMGPKPLAVNRAEGIGYQEVVAGRQGRKRFLPIYLEALLRLQDGETIDMPAWADRMARAIDGLNGIGDEDRAVLMDTLRGATDMGSLPAVRIHGDFMPWNIIHFSHGGIALVDWEDSVEAGLPLFDLVYFHTMSAELFGRAPFLPGFSRMATCYLARLGIPRRHLSALTRVCLFFDWWRCRLESGKERRAAWLLSWMKRYSKEGLP